MTLVLSTRYPSQTVSGDPGYPLGKARNRVSPGDGTGTPFESDWVNDVWGSLQAILDAGGITASGSPDAVGASDIVSALRVMMVRPSARYTINSGTASPCVFTAVAADAGFSLVGGGTQIKVPSIGKYLVTWGGEMTSSTSGSVQRLQLRLSVNSTTITSASGVRHSTAAIDLATMSRSAVITVANTTNDVIMIYPGGTGTVTVDAAFSNNSISVAKIS
jgi:hypothetical protein